MPRRIESLLFVLLCLYPLIPLAEDYPLLQPLVDATPEGDTLVPPPGTYAGPLVITRPINSTDKTG